MSVDARTAVTQHDSAAPSSEPTEIPADGLGAETWATIDRWLAYQVWQSRVPGAQVAVGLGGRVVFSAAYGHADVEQDTAMTTSHLFHIASQSKTFTATVIMRLAEQGRLRLDDTIGSHVTELADHDLGDVTVRELLGHTGGLLRDGEDAGCWQGERPFPDTAELLSLVGSAGKRPPGELFAYSNLGYGLLGMLIENVTGSSYASAADEHVVGPLGLINTFGGYRPERDEQYATGYTGLHAAASREPMPHVDTHALDAAAGFTSTAEDLVAYYSAHVLGDDRLLSDRSKRRMQGPHSPTDPAKPHGQTYGFGMDAEDLGDRQVVGHGGGFPGHITRTMFDPQDGLVVSALTNAIDGPANTLVTGVITIIDDARAHHGHPLPDSVVDHTGRWASTWGVTDIAVVGNRLLGLHPGEADPVAGADVLTVETPDQLRISSGRGFGSVAETVTFSRSGAMRYGGVIMQRLDTLPRR